MVSTFFRCKEKEKRNLSFEKFLTRYVPCDTLKLIIAYFDKEQK